MHRFLLSTSVVTAVLVALPSGVPVATAAEPVPGARTLGDRLFPDLGNGGYDAQDYDVSVTYQEGVETMPASVTMRAAATQALSEFSLDSVGQRIHAVTVDGRAAGFSQEKEKLVVTPPAAIRDHHSFTVRVDYTADRAQNPVPPGTHLPPGVEWPLKSWVDTPDGFALMGQPDRAHLFFPSNDHPSDKADFTFRITAPADRTAVANGTPIARDTRDGVTTSVYRTAHPIPTDVVQIAVGRFREVDQTGPGGLPVRSHLTLAPFNGAPVTDAMERTARETPGQLAWLAGEIGRPFPFERYGVLGLASDYDGVALETATVSTFGAGLSLTPKQEAPTLVHEMTHQYFGDAVSVRTWDDMWLSEGHARYYERRYAAARGFINLDQELKSSYERDQQQRTEVGPMGRLKLAASVLYDTDVPGQLMLTGLRTLVGDNTFRRIEQSFVDQFRDRAASTQDYVDVANQVSGRDLTTYFHDWLYSPVTPPMPGHPDWHSAPANS